MATGQDAALTLAQKTHHLHDEIQLMSAFGSRAQLYPKREERRLRSFVDVSYGFVLSLGDAPDPQEQSGRLSRTARILDSLAQVAVSDREVVAVGICYISNGRFKFVFAANDGISKSTQNYLAGLYKSIKALAQEKMAKEDPNVNRHEATPPRKYEDLSDRIQSTLAVYRTHTKWWACLADNIPHHLGKIDDIYTRIFTHTILKLKSRFDKNFGYVIDIEQEIRGIPGLDDKGRLLDFINVVKVIHPLLQQDDIQNAIKQPLLIETLVELLQDLSGIASDLGGNNISHRLSRFLDGRY
jgi:hypothetical protein